MNTTTKNCGEPESLNRFITSKNSVSPDVNTDSDSMNTDLESINADSIPSTHRVIKRLKSAQSYQQVLPRKNILDKAIFNSFQTLKAVGLSSIFALSSFGIGGLTLTAVGVVASTTPTTSQANIVAADFSDLVEQVTPGVARVNVVKKVSQEDLARAQTAELLRQFFGDRVLIPGAETTPAIEYSYGTAFFVTSDGYLLTNHHVIADADKITITLKDRTELDATLVGTDERSDVAVLKVTSKTGSPFPALPLGDSSTLRVGEPVLAIGSPFGFDYSASAGIVSANSRNFTRDASVPFIQTDVALNPGNSGGPLFNKRGEVIGINSRIFSGTGGYMGLSFSIPINAAENIYQQLKNNGEVTRAYLGIFPQDLDRNLAEAYGLSKPQGALVIKTTPDSPAEAAGLTSGDIITQYNGKQILEAADLIFAVSQSKPGDRFVAQVMRQGKQITVTGNVTTLPSDVVSDVVDKTSENRVRLGVRIQAIPKANQEQFGGVGVLITEVDPTGLAARSGLRAGDVITNLHQRPIENIADFQEILSQLPNEGVVTIEVIRQGVPAIIGLRLD